MISGKIMQTSRCAYSVKLDLKQTVREQKSQLSKLTLVTIFALTGQCVLAAEDQSIGSSGSSDLQTVEHQDSISDESTAEREGLVTIVATRHAKDNALINHFISAEDITIAPASVSELLASHSGLAVNGQPGLFQTLSIRGLARQRVHAYINGMRITSERRAGVAASFIDPLLLAGAEVTQGPASTYYGSGAIAGSIHLMTKQQDAHWFNAGYQSDGSERNIAFGHGGESYVAGFAYRHRNNGDTVDGIIKNNQFTQHSLYYQQHFELGEYQLEWQLIESRGTDIGKDNSRFPTDRITSYPEENHWLSQLTLNAGSSWNARLYFHQQDLVTTELRPAERVNQVENSSLDIGLSLDQSWEFDQYHGQLGVDYFARRNVDSMESERAFNADLILLPGSRFSSLSDGEENEVAAFATINRDFDTWALHSGVRFNYQSQQSKVSQKVSDDYLTYFLTAQKKLNRFVDVTMTYGSGFRFASLSERLFTGTTGRGQTIGNADLTPEESQSYDIGVNIREDHYSAELHYFKTQIDDFIERVRIDDDTRTYQNITNGELTGWQYQASFSPLAGLSIGLSGQGVSGEDQAGGRLADIPAKQHRITVNYEQDNWFSRFSYTERREKSSIGDGETPLNGASIASANFGYRINQHWTMQLSIENLLDESYFSSADDLGTLASGREVGVSVYLN